MGTVGTRRVRAEGLGGGVEIYRDELGIPHVRAGTVAGAFAGQGYVTAVDRLFQLEVYRRRAAGRWAEVAGPAHVTGDLYFRRLGIEDIARRATAALSPPDRAIFDAYAAGVNARIAEGAAAWPPELRGLGMAPEPWEPWQSWAIFLHLNGPRPEAKLARTALLTVLAPEVVWQLRPNAGNEYVAQEVGTRPRLEGDGPDERWGRQLGQWLADAAGLEEPGSAWGIDDESSSGSNSWAVAGSRTASGQSLLAGDPHRVFTTPNVFYQVHLAAEGDGGFDAIGTAFPGLPGIPYNGHNAEVAWCVTHGTADDSDLFIERFDGSGRYLEEPGTWVDPDVRVEHIAVRGGASVPVQMVRTARGVLLAGGPEAGVGIVVRWIPQALTDSSPSCLLPMLRARNAAELEESMRGWVVPSNNLLAADTDGDVRYRLRGRLPVRDPRNGWSAVPGWERDHWWSGWVPFEEMPTGRPANGLFVTANTRPADGGPYVAHQFASSWRARRVLQLLSENQAVDRAAVERIHGDFVSLAARVFVDRIHGLRCSDPGAEELRQLLAGWDGSMELRSVAATLYTVTRRELVQAIAKAIGLAGVVRVLDYELSTAQMLSLALPALLEVGAFDEVLRQSLEPALLRAAEWLSSMYGPDRDSWSWGAAHTTNFPHPLGSKEMMPPEVSVPGDGETVRMTGVTGPALRTGAGSVARYLFDLADWEACGWVVPHGPSADPADLHFSDQQAAWADARLLPMHYGWEGILARGDHVVTLVDEGALGV